MEAQFADMTPTAEDALDVVQQWMETTQPKMTPDHPVINIADYGVRAVAHKAMWALTSPPLHNTVKAVDSLYLALRQSRLRRTAPLSPDDKCQVKYLENQILLSLAQDEWARVKALDEVYRKEYAEGYANIGDAVVALEASRNRQKELEEELKELKRVRRGTEAQYYYLSAQQR